MTSLAFHGVTVRFGAGRAAITAVDGADLTVPSGAVVGLVGESGSGKSTLARAAVGLATLAAGRILLDGADIGGLRGGRARRRRRVQLVFQDPYSSLDPRMTVGEHVGEAVAANARIGRRARAAEVARLLDLVGIGADRAALLPAQLSGGQRQRVALARALGADPAVLIADEITSALDVSVQGSVLNVVRDLQRRLGLTMLFISHNLAVVRYLSDVVAVMYLGRVVEVAPVEELLAAPRHPYTRALVAAVPRLGAGADAHPDWAALDRDPPDPHEPPAGCRFHPRCPVGPLVHPERTACVERDPGLQAALRPHRAACHFTDDPKTIPHAAEVLP